MAAASRRERRNDKHRHVCRWSRETRLVERDWALTYADAVRRLASVGDARSPPSNRSNRRLTSARLACLPTRDSTNMTNGIYAVQKIITKAIFFTEHETICI
jgi:hypothetical protein